MINQATSRLDWDNRDASGMPGASMVRGTAWAVAFSLPIWALLIWVFVKLF